MNDLLLDTCALLWLGAGRDLRHGAQEVIAQRSLHVSRITVWEIANLVRKRRLALAMPPLAWFLKAVEQMGASLPPLSLEVLADSCALPGDPPSDPADRIIIATARGAGLIVVTRDEKILRYSRTGHVRTMEC
jgi:PIN domain nuclease of toxin-antitoxin system